MPNYCTNHVHIHGKRENIAVLWDAITDVNEVPNLMAVRPRPDDIGDDWYGWSIDNWGTKWEFIDINYFDKDDESIDIQGDTAWSPPLALLAFIAEQYGVNCHISYSEVGMDFCGVAAFAPNGEHAISDGPISDHMPEVDEDDINAWHEAFMETLEAQINHHETVVYEGIN